MGKTLDSIRRLSPKENLLYDYMGESAKDVDSPIDVTIYLKDFHILKEG